MDERTKERPSERTTDKQTMVINPYTLWLPPQKWLPPSYGSRSFKLFWVTFLPIFACRGGPGRRRRGRGPPRHAKIDFFLLARTFHENIFEAKASRKPCENLAKTSRNPNQNTRLIKRVSGPAPGRRHQFEQTYLFKKRCTNLYVYEQYVLPVHRIG